MVKLFIKIKHIVLGWWYHIRGYNYELMNTRMSICNQCDMKIKLTKDVSICASCGCVLQAKNRVVKERCPQNKW